MDGATHSGGRWLAIVNPAAGNGAAGRNWPAVADLLDSACVEVSAVFTGYKYHAVELTVGAVTGGVRHIIVVGGRSTLHEVVNGLFIQRCVAPAEVTIGFIPVHGRKDCMAECAAAVGIIAGGYSALKPVAAVSYQQSGFRQERYMVCGAGIGREARIAKRVSRLREEGVLNDFRQWLVAARMMVACRPVQAELSVDGAVVAEGGIVGALLEMKEEAGGNVLELRLTSRGRRGCRGRMKACGNGECVAFRGAAIAISAPLPLSVEVDGEPLGFAPVTFRLVDNAIRVAVAAAECEPQ